MNPVDRQLPLRRLTTPIAVALLLLLAGCSTLIPGQGPPPNLYRLTPKSTFDPSVPSVDWQLVLSPPSSPGAVDTIRIVLAPGPTRIDYYAEASWTDRMPAMLQALMLESFENSGKIISVGRRAVGLRSDYELRTDVREFQAEYYQHPGQPPECAGAPACVDIGVNVKLVYSPTRTIVATRDFTAYAPVVKDEMVQIVEAFDAALGAVLKDLVVWTLIEGTRDWESRADTRPRSLSRRRIDPTEG